VTYITIKGREGFNLKNRAILFFPFVVLKLQKPNSFMADLHCATDLAANSIVYE